MRAMKIAAVVFGLWMLFVFDPACASWLPGCPLHAMTGLNCPGCGTTRALHQLLHGHVATAFVLNPLTVSLLPLAACVAVRRGRVAVRPVWMWSLLVVVVVFGIARNISLTP